MLTPEQINHNIVNVTAWKIEKEMTKTQIEMLIGKLQDYLNSNNEEVKTKDVAYYDDDWNFIWTYEEVIHEESEDFIQD